LSILVGYQLIKRSKGQLSAYVVPAMSSHCLPPDLQAASRAWLAADPASHHLADILGNEQHRGMLWREQSVVHGETTHTHCGTRRRGHARALPPAGLQAPPRPHNSNPEHHVILPPHRDAIHGNATALRREGWDSCSGRDANCEGAARGAEWTRVSCR
jgi:hypothetical protein